MKKKDKFKDCENFKKKPRIGKQNSMLWEPKEPPKPMNEAREKKKRWKLKLELREVNSFNMLDKNSRKNANEC